MRSADAETSKLRRSSHIGICLVVYRVLAVAVADFPSKSAMRLISLDGLAGRGLP